MEYERGKSMDIGNNIATLRKNKNLTQEELANILNVSTKTISSYETNRNIPNIETLILLAKALNCSVDSLIGLTSNDQEINNIYQTKNTKNSILKAMLIGIILILPMIFFLWAGYVSLSALMAGIYANTNLENCLNLANLSTIDQTNLFIEPWNLLKIYAFEYVIYSILFIINFILYKKNCKIILIVLNSLILVILLINILLSILDGDFYNYDYLMYLVCSVIGIIFGFKLSNKQ